MHFYIFVFLYMCKESVERLVDLYTTMFAVARWLDIPEYFDAFMLL